MPNFTPSRNGTSSVRRAARPRWRALLALGVAVLAVHLWLLSPSGPTPKADVSGAEAPDARSLRPAPVTVAAHPAPPSPQPLAPPAPSARLAVGPSLHTLPVPPAEAATAGPPIAPTQRPSAAPTKTAAEATTAGRTLPPSASPNPVAAADGGREPERTPPSSPAPEPDATQGAADAARTAPPAHAAERPAPTIATLDGAAQRVQGDAALPAPTPNPAPAPAAKAAGSGQPAPVAPTPSTPPLRWKTPAPVTLHYRIEATRKGLSLPATGTLQWAHDGTTYNAQLTIDAAWARSRSQTSRGQIDPLWGIQPQRFGDRNRSEQAAHFERSRQPAVVRFSANTPDAVLTPSTQDRLSVLFQLAGWLSAAPNRWSNGDRLTVHTVGARDAQDWVFEWGAPETLELPLGRMTAWPLRRAPTHPYDNRVELWLAPSLNHLPVRVRWTQANGDVVDQQLERVSAP